MKHYRGLKVSQEQNLVRVIAVSVAAGVLKAISTVIDSGAFIEHRMCQRIMCTV